jgi:tetratricopeptide (TPR) repeat protein
MPLHLSTLWDFRDPAASEARFTAALASATGRRRVDFAHADRADVGAAAGFRACARRSWPRSRLGSPSPGRRRGCVTRSNSGRTWSSATHPPESQTPEAIAAARAAYTDAFETARDARLDELAVDALHMMAMVDSAPEHQLEWGMKALAFVESSDQPGAKKWEASLRNNIGYALSLLERYPEALDEFRRALVLREASGNAVTIRIAHWMIAKTLRQLGRADEALEIQLRLNDEWAAAGEPSPYVWEELATLYRARGENEKADDVSSARGECEGVSASRRALGDECP